MTGVTEAVLLAALAALCTDIGLILLKQEGDTLPPLRWQAGLAGLKAFIRNPLWLVGLFLQPVGYACYILALARGPLSLVQPIMGAGVVLFVLFAVIVLKEPIGMRAWGAIATTVIGIGLLTLSLSPATDLQLPRIDSSALIVFSACLLGLGWLASFSMRRRDQGLWMAIESGLFLGLASIYAKGLAVGLSQGSPQESWASLAFNPYLWLTFLGNVLGFILLLSAFQQGRAGIVLPLSAAPANLIPVAGGLLVLGERLPPSMALVLRLIAIVLMLSGATVLAGYSHVADGQP
jgi:drug/metabolite transporter (DMT)-like permease